MWSLFAAVYPEAPSRCDFIARCNDDKTSSTSISFTQAIAAQPFVLWQGAQPTVCMSIMALELLGRHKPKRCRPAAKTTAGTPKHAATCPATESMVTIAVAFATVATNCSHDKTTR